MKKSIFFFAVLLISMITVKGQTPFYSCMINFEDDPCWEGSYHNVDIPGSNNIWNICTPHKTVFDSAYSVPHAILTDSTGPYPVNTTSSFIIKSCKYQYCECAPILAGFYKMDSDTLNDVGRIEISTDHGATWLDAINDSVNLNISWVTQKPVLTGRIHQWKEFFARLWNYGSIDTLYYRFTFTSDNVQTNQEGWMLDNIMVIEHTEGIQDIGSANAVSICPNPSSGLITVSVKSFTAATEVSVFDMLGQKRLQQTLEKSKQDFDLSGLSKGIYMVRVVGGKTDAVRKVIVE
jgi:hypothetical protein